MRQRGLKQRAEQAGEVLGRLAQLRAAAVGVEIEQVRAVDVVLLHLAKLLGESVVVDAQQNLEVEPEAARVEIDRAEQRVPCRRR